MNRRNVKWLLVLVLFSVAAWYYTRTLPGQADLQPLNQALAPETSQGWRVARPPDKAGPYRRTDGPQFVPRGGMGSVIIGRPPHQETVRLGARDDADQLAVPLYTADGSVTVAVLER